MFVFDISTLFVPVLVPGGRDKGAPDVEFRYRIGR